MRHRLVLMASQALYKLDEEVRLAKNGLTVFDNVMGSASEFSFIEFLNVRAGGIEILISKDHRVALEQELSKVLRCTFETVGDSSCRSVAVASAAVHEERPWLITLISPIGLNLEAERLMFEQLRAEYGIGEHFRAALERRGVVPSPKNDVKLCEVPAGLIAVPTGEPVGSETIARFSI